jgi:Domain of unknown function (DUF1918)
VRLPSLEHVEESRAEKREVAMVEVGNRIAVESEKVGVEPRAGTVVGVQGSLMNVRWDDGQESSFIPSAGSMMLMGSEPSEASEASEASVRPS